MKPTLWTPAEQCGGGSQALSAVGLVPRVADRHGLRQRLAPAWCVAVGDLGPDVAHQRAQFAPRCLLLLAAAGAVSQMPVELFIGEGGAEAVDASTGDALLLAEGANVALQVLGNRPTIEPHVGIVGRNSI